MILFVFVGFFAMAMIAPPVGASRTLLGALAFGTWWFGEQTQKRGSRIAAIAIFLIGWFSGALFGWMALVAAVLVRRALVGKTTPVTPTKDVATPTTSAPVPRTPEQVLADWPPNARDVFAAAREEHGDGYVDVLLSDTRRYVRYYAIEEFGRIRETLAVTALFDLLFDKDFPSRRRASAALARIGTQEARAALFEGFRRAWTARTRMDDSERPIEDPDEYAALNRDADGLREIAEAMVMVGSQAIEPLTTAVREGSPEVVSWTVVPLGALGAVETIPLMFGRLTEENAFMQGEVSEAIRRIGPRAMPLLQAKQGDGSPVAQAVAARLIRSLEGRPPEWVEAPPDIHSP